MKKLTHYFLLAVTVSIISISVNAQARLDKIAKAGVIKIGMSGSQPPFSMEKKDGSLMGYEVDIANLLAKSMDVKLEIVRLPFNELLSSLEKGKVDLVMSGMSITVERNMKVAFVGPYMVSGKSILTKSDRLSKVQKIEDLNQADLKIASLKGSTSEKFVSTLLPEANSMPVATYDEAVEKLLKDEINIVLADYPVCAITILRNPSANLATLTEPLTIEPIGLALLPDDALFINFLENYFSALVMSGVLEQLKTNWFENGSWLLEMK